jgi:uncharacterized protein YlxW (UPF0749 family)
VAERIAQYEAAAGELRAAVEALGSAEAASAAIAEERRQLDITVATEQGKLDAERGKLAAGYRALNSDQDVLRADLRKLAEAQADLAAAVQAHADKVEAVERVRKSLSQAA